jgi:hypothetical protein
MIVAVTKQTDKQQNRSNESSHMSGLDIIEEKSNTHHHRSSKHIVILGGGFAGIGVLKKLQKEFHNDSRVEITLVSKENFLLFTPMLPEVASGMIETRHIVTPVRSFCRKAKFYEAVL